MTGPPGASTDEDLVVTDDDRARWRAQVPRTRAGRRCACGTCPSVVLTDPSGAAPDARSGRVLLEAGTAGALLLFVDGDVRLSRSGPGPGARAVGPRSPSACPSAWLTRTRLAASQERW